MRTPAKFYMGSPLRKRDMSNMCSKCHTYTYTVLVKLHVLLVVWVYIFCLCVWVRAACVCVGCVLRVSVLGACCVCLCWVRAACVCVGCVLRACARAKLWPDGVPPFLWFNK